MKRVKPVSAVQGGVTVRKIAYRDMTLFPDTDAGDAALMTAIQNGTVPLYPRPADGRILATVPNRVVETRTDSGGRLYISSKAPVLTRNVLAFPPASGISVPIPEQTAQGVVGFDRFVNRNGVGLRDHKMIVFGPWHPAVADNKHFDHFIDAINCWPFYRQNGAASSTNNLDPARKFFMYSDAEVRATAATLLAANSGSPFAGAWNAMANGHDYTSNPGAFQAIGVRMWQDARSIFDTQNRGLKYISLDLESTDDYPLNRECLGNVYKGFCSQAALDGFAVEPNLYGQSTFRVDCYNTSLKQFVTGLPEYLRDYMDLFPDPAGDATIKACNDYHGAVTDDGYFQRLWPEELDLLLRNPDNSLILLNGVPQFNTSPTQGMAYGQVIPLETSEAPHFISDFYRCFARKFIQRYWFANGYPSTESLRRPGMENVKFGADLRITSEAVAGMIYNDRPMPYWLLKLIQFYNLFETDVSLQWGDDWNQNPLAPGSASAKWPYAAGGTLEAMIHAAEEYAYYDDYHVGDAKRAWFNLDIVSSNNIDGEYVYQKLILKVKIRTINGKQYIEVFAANPLLDKTSQTIKLFWKKNGKTSKAYSIVIANGRSFHYSMFEVPGDTEFLNLSGDDLIARFADLLNVVRTWPGNYNLMTTFDSTIATPDDYDTGEVTVVTPPTGGGGTPLTFGTPTYDGPNNKLKIPVVGAVGTLTYIIVGYGVFTAQPAEGFTLPSNCINSLVAFRVHTDTQAEIAGTLQCNSSSSAPAAGNDFPTAYQWDSNSKGYVAYALVPDQTNYTVLLEPQDGQTSPGAAQALVSENNTINGLTYNRKYLFLPTFAGGTVNILAGHWKQTITNGTLSAAGIATLVDGDSSPKVVTAGTSGGGGTTPTPASSTGWFANHFGVGPNMYIFFDGQPANVADRLRVMQTAHDLGCNMCSLIVVASSMENMDWTTLNQAGAKAKQLGFKIRLVFDMSPTIPRLGQPATPYLPACPNNLIRQKNSDGVEYAGDGNTAAFSYWDDNALAYFNAILDLWIPYIKSQDWASEIVGFNAGGTSTIEDQYDYAYYPNGVFTNQLVGYDSATKAAFIAGMTAKFGNIAALNTACGTNFASFSALTLPTPSGGDMNSAFNGVYGSYFALIRALGLQRFIESVYTKVKTLAPNWTRILDTGSFIDNAENRGTADPVLISGITPGLIQMRKCNDAAQFIHEYQLDVAASGGLMTANELDSRGDTPDDCYHLVASTYVHGGRLCTLNCYNITDAKFAELMSHTGTVQGVSRGTIASMVAAGPLDIARNTIITVPFSTWTHFYNETAFNAYQAWATASNNGAIGIDMQFQSQTFS